VLDLRQKPPNYISCDLCFISAVEEKADTILTVFFCVLHCYYGCYFNFVPIQTPGLSLYSY